MAELNELNAIESAVIPLSEYSVSDKVKFFDNFYNFANQHVEEVKKNKWKDEDTTQWFYEEGMKILNLKDNNSLWKYYNSLSK